MKSLLKIVLIATCVAISMQVSAFTPEIKTIKLSNGEEIVARLCLPEKGQINTIVVTIHGTGPQTYLTKREGFNYYDVLADGFCEKGVGFFTYSRRGVEDGETAPNFDKVDSAKHTKYLPHNEADDIETMVTFLKKDKRFKNSKIILYGISEGTIIAAMVADRKKVEIDAIFLHGYAHENMYDIMKWQLVNEKSMSQAMDIINQGFDKNDDKVVNKQEYESEDPTAVAYKKSLFGNAVFDSIDLTKDSVYDVQDIKEARKMYHSFIMNRIAENDERWIWNNYFRVTMGWLREHYALEPNKTRLLRVDIPIYIFHGTDDANVPVEGVYDLVERFKTCNKSNLKTFVFDKHSHDLNFANWLTKKEHSEGTQKIFDTSAEI